MATTDAPPRETPSPPLDAGRQRTMRDDRFADQVAIVTGGASGIGRALAEQLGRRGARLVIADLNIDGVDAVARELQEDGVDAVAVAADVSQSDSLESIIDEAMARHGRIDLLFNNAGVGWGGAFETMSRGEIERVLSINLGSVLRMTSLVYPIMIRQGHGHIINMASVDGLIPKPHQAAYCATKHGIASFSHSLSVEAQAHGVAVSVVCPGLVNTNIRQTSAAILRDKIDAGKAPPSKRMMSADECAQRILRGVERGQETIIIAFLRPIWWFYRFSPSLFRSITAPLFLRKMGHEQSSWLASTYSGSVRWLVRFARTGRIQ